MALTIKGTTEQDFPIVTITPVLDNPTSASTAQVTFNDVVMNRTTTLGVDNNAAISVGVTNASFSNYTVTNNTPAVATLDINNKLTMVGAGGTGSLKLSTKGIGDKLIPYTVSHVGSVTSDALSGGKTGTLLAHIWANIAGMISGKTPSAATQNWVPNSTTMFSAPLDLSAVSFGGSVGWCYTLISPWHVITSHMASTGSINFYQTDGTLVTRNITQTFRLPWADGDNFIGVLDAPITTITPMNILPPNTSTYLKGYSTVHGIPVLRKKQNGGDRLCIMMGDTISGTVGERFSWNKTLGSIFEPWALTCTGGDSDGVVFVPINTGAGMKAVLINHTNFGTYPDGSYYGGATFYGGANFATVQSTMNTASLWARTNGYASATDQTLTSISLASFAVV